MPLFFLRLPSAWAGSCPRSTDAPGKEAFFLASERAKLINSVVVFPRPCAFEIGRGKYAVSATALSRASRVFHVDVSLDRMIDVPRTDGRPCCFAVDATSSASQLVPRRRLRLALRVVAPKQPTWRFACIAVAMVADSPAPRLLLRTPVPEGRAECSSSSMRQPCIEAWRRGSPKVSLTCSHSATCVALCT